MTGDLLPPESMTRIPRLREQSQTASAALYVAYDTATKAARQVRCRYAAELHDRGVSMSDAEAIGNQLADSLRNAADGFVAAAQALHTLDDDLAETQTRLKEWGITYDRTGVRF